MSREPLLMIRSCIPDSPSSALDKLILSYGNTWPPKPDFSDWPTCWNIYQTLCDEMPGRLNQTGNPDRFRDWMKSALHQVVEFELQYIDILTFIS